MTWAVDAVGSGDDITVDTLLETHRLRMADGRLEEHGGHVRTVQNWIGGSGYNPCSAAFVPPPPEYVPDLLEDLCDFCNDDSLPALALAALTGVPASVASAMSPSRLTSPAMAMLPH